ncbi:MAG: hypothetical protein ACREUL_03490 [Steroidobacteraceae bacterium]
MSFAATPGSPIEYPPRTSLAAQTLGDAAAYFTAPLHWNGRDWEYFGGALAAIAVAHHYDSQARTHFDSGSKSPLGPANSGTLTDALPGAALFLGTWGYAHLIGSHASDPSPASWSSSRATPHSVLPDRGSRPRISVAFNFRNEPYP